MALRDKLVMASTGGIKRVIVRNIQEISRALSITVTNIGYITESVVMTTGGVVAVATQVPQLTVISCYLDFLPGLLLLGPALGGVTGRPLFSPPYWYFAFLSAGFRIWKEHIKVSSTLIIPPALSNSPQ